MTTSRSFSYEGRISLGEQEGGHAAPSIELHDEQRNLRCASLDEVLADMGVPEGWFADPARAVRARITVELL